MAARGGAEQTDTRSAILDVAERLVQTRGFNAFSYADVAGELGITKASLHYHFPSKAELGDALMVRYADHFAEALAAIDADHASPPAKLAAYVDLYLGVLRAERMCLCGMLAAEYHTLPNPMRKTVITFLDDNHIWLVHLLEEGDEQASLRLGGTADAAAHMILGALEGAMLVARAYGDTTQFQVVADHLLAEFTTALPADSSNRGT